MSDAQALAGGDVFCRVHGNKVADVSGFYDRKTGQTFVKFEGKCTIQIYTYSRFCPMGLYVICDFSRNMATGRLDS